MGERKTKPKTKSYSMEDYGVSVPWTNGMKNIPSDKHLIHINPSSKIAKCFSPPTRLSPQENQVL